MFNVCLKFSFFLYPSGESREDLVNLPYSRLSISRLSITTLRLNQRCRYWVENDNINGICFIQHGKQTHQHQGNSFLQMESNFGVRFSNLPPVCQRSSSELQLDIWLRILWDEMVWIFEWQKEMEQNVWKWYHEYVVVLHRRERLSSGTF